MPRRPKPAPVLTWGAAMLDPPWKETGGQGPSWGMTKRGADRTYDLIATKKVPGVVYGSGLWTPADDAHLYLWATNNFLLDAAWVMGELGFRYVTKVTWPKEDREEYWRCLGRERGGRSCGMVSSSYKWLAGNALLPRCPACGNPKGLWELVYVTKAKRKFGLGQYFRGADECVLFGVRGRGLLRRTAHRSLTTLLYGRLREHSRKPEEAYELVEARSVGPLLDMFAPSSRLLGPARPGWAHWGQLRGAPGPVLNVASSLRHGEQEAGDAAAQ